MTLSGTPRMELVDYSLYVITGWQGGKGKRIMGNQTPLFSFLFFTLLSLTDSTQGIGRDDAEH